MPAAEIDADRRGRGTPELHGCAVAFMVKHDVFDELHALELSQDSGYRRAGEPGRCRQASWADAPGAPDHVEDLEHAPPAGLPEPGGAFRRHHVPPRLERFRRTLTMVGS